MASPTNDDRPPSGGRPTLWAASRGLGLFFLLRFFATHATIAYLAYSQLAPDGGSGNATSSRDGISTTIGTSLSEAASHIDKLKSMINRKDQKSRQRPEPIIKTVTKTVTKKRKMTVLSEAQEAQLEKEMASFVVPPSDIVVPPISDDDDDDFGDGEGSDVDGGGDGIVQQIEAKLSTLSQLITQLDQQLLPEVTRAQSKLKAEVHAADGESWDSDRRKGAALGEGSLGLRREEQYGEALASLRKLMAVGGGGDGASSSYQDMDDDRLKEIFDGVLKELDVLVVTAEKMDDARDASTGTGASMAGRANDVVDEDAIATDLGVAIRSVLPNKDSKKTSDAPVKVCDPAFLSREVPAGCWADGTSGGDVGGNGCSPPSADDSSSSAAIPPDNIARESDLFSLVGLIEEVLRDRSGRFNDIDSDSTDAELASVGPLTDTEAQMRLKKAVNAQVIQYLAKIRKAKAETAKLEATKDPEQHEKVSGTDDEDKVCTTEKDVEYLMDEGLDALHRRKDLREELISALRLLYDERGEQFDASSVDWSTAVASTLAPNGPKSTPHPDWSRAADSSYAHRGSVRTLIDTPKFHDVIGKLDGLADAVGGYNEGIDRLIDFIAGDERDGGSVSKTVKTAILNAAGRIRIPPQFYKWREKAGILAA